MKINFSLFKNIIYIILVKKICCSDFDVLIWSNEFNDYSDLNNWEIQTNNNNWRNNEYQTYTTENVYIKNGSLNIVAKNENSQYTSGKVWSYNSFLYGRIEARIKLPKGNGLWPAFWLFPRNNTYNNWPSSGEIDIMETTNNNNFIKGSIHYGDNYTEDLSDCYMYDDYSNDFHVYSLEWEYNEIRWYVDDNLFCTKNNWWNDYSYPAPFNQNTNIIFNIAIRDNIDKNFLPQIMMIDYINIYNKNNTEINTSYPIIFPPRFLPNNIQTKINKSLSILNLNYIGCFKDFENKIIKNDFYKMSSQNATIQTCYEYCYLKETLYFGVIHSNKCYCFNDYDLNQIDDDKNCMTNFCEGDNNLACGGNSNILIYSII